MPYKDPEKQREWQRDWMRRRRAEWMQENGPCTTCGSSERLEVDHIDPSTKLLKPSSVWSLSTIKREAELSKCQVLCYVCHKKKTRRQISFIQPHGTRGRYDRKDEFKCRCDLCRAAHAQRMREYRALTA